MYSGFDSQVSVLGPTAARAKIKEINQARKGMQNWNSGGPVLGQGKSTSLIGMHSKYTYPIGTSSPAMKIGSSTKVGHLVTLQNQLNKINKQGPMHGPMAPLFPTPTGRPINTKSQGAKIAGQAESNKLKKGPDQKLGVPGKSRGFSSAAADSFSGMKWKGKSMMAGAGVVAGGIAWNRMGESKNSPIGAGVSTAALTAAGLAGMKYGAGAAVKPLMKSGRIGSAKTAANLAMRANRIGIGKGAAIAGGGIAALGAIRNMTGI